MHRQDKTNYNRVLPTARACKHTAAIASCGRVLQVLALLQSLAVNPPRANLPGRVASCEGGCNRQVVSVIFSLYYNQYKARPERVNMV